MCLALTEQEFGNTAELVGLSAAAVILLIAFGSVVAMGLPIITALLGLFIGFLGLGIVTRFMDVAEFAPVFAAMIGIGVGIDYALFIVTRFREGLKNGLDQEAGHHPRTRYRRSRGHLRRRGCYNLDARTIGGWHSVCDRARAGGCDGGDRGCGRCDRCLPAMLALIGTRIDKWSVRKPKSGDS